MATSIKDIPNKIWSRSFNQDNIHPCYYLSFSQWIKDISPHDNIGETSYLGKLVVFCWFGKNEGLLLVEGYIIDIYVCFLLTINLFGL